MQSDAPSRHSKKRVFKRSAESRSNMSAAQNRANSDPAAYEKRYGSQRKSKIPPFEIMRRFTAGETLAAIAADAGVTRERARQIMVAHGWTGEVRKSISKKQAAERKAARIAEARAPVEARKAARAAKSAALADVVKRMHAQGSTYQEIGAALNLSGNSACRLALRSGARTNPYRPRGKKSKSNAGQPQ